MATTTTHKGDDMALIQVTVIAGVFTTPQKQAIIERLTDAMVAIEGENMRQAALAAGDADGAGAMKPR